MCFEKVFLLFFISAFVPHCLAVCYFPDYLLGEFSMQSPTSQPGLIKYTPVSITAEAVSLWGFCNKKIGNGLYLIDSESSNGTYCLRCIHISVKSQNVIVISLAGHTDRYCRNVQAAETSCPKLDQLESTKQIILFKTKEDIRKEYCPINGRYTIHYKQNKQDYTIECSSRSSQLDNCPVGSEMNIRFRDCHFENHDLVFECLGSWEGPNQQRYLALFDTRTGSDPKPQYRCGLYKEEPGSGTVYVAFSSDSTCNTDLQNAQSGYETLALTKLIPNFSPIIHDTSCRFPSWTEGRWELVTVQGNIFTYTDLTLFKNYTFQCLEEVNQRYNFPVSADDKHILVHGKSQCDEELYTCIWLKKRGENVFEFQLATQASQYPNHSLCSPQNFQTSMWITQGRKDLSTVSPCPILGEYIGMLPNVENLCAKLSSDCISQDTMYYMVSDCSQQQIYEGSSRPKYRRKIRQTMDEAPSEKNSTEIPSASENIKNDTNANLTATTPIPVLNTTAILVMTNDSQINQTTVSAATVETTTKVITTTADLRSEPSQRVIYNDNYQTSSEISVGSYYAENKNFGDFSRDIRLLPAPISSSTVSPYVPYRRNYQPPAPATPNYYPYNDQPRYTDYTNYRDDRRYRNDYYQRSNYDRNYPAWNHSQLQMPQSNQMYVMDPMNAYRPVERKTVIALPPVQLPPVPPTYRPMYSSGRQNFVHMFKEREYRCLGQWQENNLTYTFTQRKDIGTYECFVGTMISQYEISVREAGKHCERNMNSLMLEMRLSRISSCAENRSSTTVGFNTPTTQTTPVTVTTTKPTINKRILQHTTRPWRPLNNMTRLQPPVRSKNGSTSGCTRKVPSYLFLLSVLHVVIYKFLNFAFTNL